MSKKLPSGILVKADLTKDLERRKKKQPYINVVSYICTYSNDLLMTEKFTYVSKKKRMLQVSCSIEEGIKWDVCM